MGQSEILSALHSATEILKTSSCDCLLGMVFPLIRDEPEFHSFTGIAFTSIPEMGRFAIERCGMAGALFFPHQRPLVWALMLSCNPENCLPYFSILQLEKFRYSFPVKVPTSWERVDEQGIFAVVLKWLVAFPPGRIIAGQWVCRTSGEPWPIISHQAQPCFWTDRWNSCAFFQSLPAHFNGRLPS